MNNPSDALLTASENCCQLTVAAITKGECVRMNKMFSEYATRIFLLEELFLKYRQERTNSEEHNTYDILIEFVHCIANFKVLGGVLSLDAFIRAMVSRSLRQVAKSPFI